MGIQSSYLLVEIEDPMPIDPTPPQPLPTKPQPLPPTPPTLPPQPSAAPPPKPTRAPEVLKQEGEPCGHNRGRYGLRTSPLRFQTEGGKCAAGLECKPRGYSYVYECVRIEPVTPGYNPWDNGQGGGYNPGHGGSYNPGHGGSYNTGYGGSYRNGKCHIVYDSND